jgi:hypothetical protein
MNPAPAPAYPLPRPTNGADTRFSLGPALDVAAVLTRHGYPAITTGSDLIRLQQALHSLIYQPTTPATALLTTDLR